MERASSISSSWSCRTDATRLASHFKSGTGEGTHQMESVASAGTLEFDLAARIPTRRRLSWGSGTSVRGRDRIAAPPCGLRVERTHAVLSRAPAWSARCYLRRARARCHGEASSRRAVRKSSLETPPRRPDTTIEASTTRHQMTRVVIKLWQRGRRSKYAATLVRPVPNTVGW